MSKQTMRVNPSKCISYQQALKLAPFEAWDEFVITRGFHHRKRRVEKRRIKRLLDACAKARREWAGRKDV